MRIATTVFTIAVSLQGVTAVQAEEIPAEILGAWQLEFRTPEYEKRTPVVVLGRQFDELVACYFGANGRETCSEARIVDDAVHFKLKPQEFNGDMTVEVEARLQGSGRCTGSIDYADVGGDAGTIRFTGEQLKLDSADEVSTWGLDFATPDGKQRNPTVTVITHEGKTYAWYSSEDYELLADSLMINDDRVEMKVTTKTSEGEKVNVTFRGKVEGESISGTANWNLPYDSGTFSFTGREK